MANQTEHWTPPASFPKPSRSSLIDITGLEFNGYKVTRQAQSNGNESQWQIACLSCGRPRITSRGNIVRSAAGDNSLALCKCDLTEDDTSLVEERLAVSPAQARVLCSVVAHERAHGCGVLRSILKDFVGREPDTITLVRRGLLVHTGNPAVVTATEKTRKGTRPAEPART